MVLLYLIWKARAEPIAYVLTLLLLVFWLWPQSRAYLPLLVVFLSASWCSRKPCFGEEVKKGLYIRSSGIMLETDSIIVYKGAWCVSHVCPLHPCSYAYGPNAKCLLIIASKSTQCSTAFPSKRAHKFKRSSQRGISLKEVLVYDGASLGPARRTSQQQIIINFLLKKSCYASPTGYVLKENINLTSHLSKQLLKLKRSKERTSKDKLAWTKF